VIFGSDRALRMKATAAAMSLTACSPRTSGGFASGGWFISGGRVLRP